MNQPNLSVMDHSAKVDLIRLLLTENAELKSWINVPEICLAKESSNPIKLPLSDGPRKPASKSLRHVGQHTKCGQKRHKDSLRGRISEPDVIIYPLPVICGVCGNALSETHVSKACQIFDIPPQPAQSINQTSHHGSALYLRGKVYLSSFLEGVIATAQCGLCVQAAVIYLTQHHMLPIRCTAQILRDTYGVALSPPGALVRMIRTAAGNLAPVVAYIANAVQNARVAHFDETGVRYVGKFHYWLNTAAPTYLTWMGMYTRSGQEVLDALNILPLLQGTDIHDGWAPIRKYDCCHGLCNAHHLPELALIHKQYGKRWARNTIALSLAARREVAQSPLIGERSARINADFTAVITKATVSIRSRNVETAHHIGANLLRRLQEYRGYVLRFLSDPDVFFTNKIVEQAVRIPKVKQKISGCFQTFDGGSAFCTFRSYLEILLSRRSVRCTHWFSLFKVQPCCPPWHDDMTALVNSYL